VRTAKVVVALCLFLAVRLAASGPTGVFAVIEKVVFDVEANPAIMKVWGAFSFVDGGISSSGPTTTPARGFLYFAMPALPPEKVKLVQNEWFDLKKMAGTGEGVAFGNWGYIGAFGPSGPSHGVYVTVQVGERSYRGIPLAVLTHDPPAVDPTPYITNTGLVKLSATGSHAAIVKQLKDALAR
jgi:hypothetical protein